ncbi:MAG TPA: porin family protein, partial [Xanthobacteraceae bacterium]|nr:porin family protein [Xanthobacteraceae bacterium]
MKTRLAAGFAASVLLGMPAFAADLPVKAFTKAPALAAYDWTGFYLGVNVGLGVARNETTWAIPAANSLAKTNLGPFGAIGGAQVGYNWQWRNLVFGLETDFQGAGVTENRFCGDTCVDGTAIRIEQKLDWFG